MNIYKPVLLAILLIFDHPVHAQPPAAPPIDVYANFLGTWVGTNQHMEKGTAVETAVKLEITETKKNNAMRIDYTYGKQGEHDFGRETRFVTIASDKNIVMLQWKGEEEDPWAAQGLGDFMKTGLGVFTLQRVQGGAGNTTITYRGTFFLQPDTFSYQWEVSTDGKKFEATGIWELKRVLPVNSSPQP